MGYSREVEIGASLATVWRAWTTREKTEAWLSPRARVEFVEGGAYEFFWDEDPALDSTLGCRLLTIEPQRRLVFEWQGKTEYLPMFTEPHGPTTVEVEFRETQDGVTLVLSQSETRLLPKWAEYDEWMSAAWEYALRALKSHCEQGERAPGEPERAKKGGAG
jgi:uncharacterized protein YndB with AHSA1/START domain